MILSCFIGIITGSENSRVRDGKLFPVFQLIRFPNQPCNTGGSKNGTCYTSEECSSRGGSSIGSCASGFGVCCTFTVGCGATINENCTYFEATGLGSGECRTMLCPCSNNICQMRLDFNTFVITGPSTNTNSETKILNGVVSSSAAKTANYASTCATDIFTITNAPNLPELCGTLTGEHVYFDSDDGCHDLNLSIGQNAIYATEPSNRQVSIKVTQVECSSYNLAPQGCDQWFYGTSGQGTVRTFNYDGGSHLANQHQDICVRRESGYCQLCWYAASLSDVDVSGVATKTAMGKQLVTTSLCCGYGTDGMKTTAGYDCIMIPGASKATGTNQMVPAAQCGGFQGLVTAKATSATTSKTVCTKQMPFRINFTSDGFEWTDEAKNPAAPNQSDKGFKLSYYQVGC